jgi:hypothetical protein
MEHRQEYPSQWQAIRSSRQRETDGGTRTGGEGSESRVSGPRRYGMEALGAGPSTPTWPAVARARRRGDRSMATEKHRGAPKKQVKKPSLKAKDKQAKKLAAQLGTPLEPRPAVEGGSEGGGSA